MLQPDASMVVVFPPHNMAPGETLARLEDARGLAIRLSYRDAAGGMSARSAFGVEWGELVIDAEIMMPLDPAAPHIWHLCKVEILNGQKHLHPLVPSHL